MVYRILKKFYISVLNLSNAPAKMLPLYLVKCRIHASDESCISSLKKVDGSKIASCFVTWQLKFQTSNITAIIISDHIWLIYASNYFYNQSIELSTTLYWNSDHYEVAKSGMRRVRRSWLTHMSRFLVANAMYIR